MSPPETHGEAARAAGKALVHGVRRSFIHDLMAADEPLPASAHADARGIPLSSVAYHARLLVSLGVVEIAATVKRRGGLESHYRLGGPNLRHALAMLPMVDRMTSRDSDSPHR